MHLNTQNRGFIRTKAAKQDFFAAFLLIYQNNIRYYDFVELGVFLESLCNAIDGIHGEIGRRAEYIDEMQTEFSCY